MQNKAGVDLARRTWNALADRQEAFIDRFYQGLFERYPDYRALFPPSAAQRSRNMIETLSLLMGIDQAAVVQANLRYIGIQHQGFRLQRNDLERFRDVFIEELGSVVGVSWSATEEQHWRRLFDTIVIPAMMQGLAGAHETNPI
ncbi:MAG: globin [Gammaproteobacteria bacterium]|nr:globin [Gammaproteobacteria bacterium]